MCKLVLPIALNVFAVVTLIPAGCGQTVTTGEIASTVKDPSGNVVIGATVQLESVDTGESRAVQSNDSGVYRFVFVEPGTYEISGRSAGLKSDTGTVTAAVGQVQTLDLNLKLEQPKSVVSVTDMTPLLNTDNAHLVYTLSTLQLDLLPLPGGDLVGIAYSAPGIVVSKGFGYGNFVSQGVGGVSNLFTVNGVDDMDPYYNINNSGVSLSGISGLLLGANEIREVSIVQNAFEGQYGRQAGAQLNYVTKSGTNSYHGNLAYSYNGTLLNANDFFANQSGFPRPPAISNQYAASFGGPMVKNKIFFFADTEGLRFALPTPTHVAVVPSPAFESYALRSIQPSQVSFYEKTFDLYNHAPSIGRAVPVTNGDGPLQDSSGGLGCGSLAGTPTGTGGTFGTDVSCGLAWVTNAPTLSSEWLLSTRVDYNLSANQRVFFRFKTDQGDIPAQTSDISPLFNAITHRPDYEGQVNHTLVITPRLVNNFIGSVADNSYTFVLPKEAAAVQAIPFRLTIRDGGANGGGFAPLGPGVAFPFGHRFGQFQIVDDVSYSRGRHVFKAGVNYRYNPESDLLDGNVGHGKFTIFRLNEFATGRIAGDSPSNFWQNFNAKPVFHIRLYNIGTYIQDQWVLTPHLKVTATVRFDRTGNPYCANRCFARLISPFPDLHKGLSIPYNESIQTGVAHAFYGTEPVIPQPRLSLAYNPGWSRNTVFGGGIGLFSDLYPASFVSNLAGNPPNIFVPLIRTGLINAGGPGSAPAIEAATVNAFESGFASGTTLTQLQQVVAPASFNPPRYYSIP